MENLSKALCEFQKEAVAAAKDSRNPHFKNEYASLASVIKAVQQGTKYGLAFTQLVDSDMQGRPVVVTRLMHSSGEVLEATTPLVLSKNDMQGMGSAISYARRYALLGIYGLAADDDDGNAAVSSRGAGSSPVTAPSTSSSGGADGPPPASETPSEDPFSFEEPNAPETNNALDMLFNTIDKQETPDALASLYRMKKSEIEAMPEEDRAQVVAHFKAAKERTYLNG